MSQLHLRAANTFATLIAIAGLLSGPSIRAEDASHHGGMLYAAFRCWGYATIAGERETADRLFEVGLRSGHGFLEAARAGRVDKDKPGLPISVQLLMEGPSDDFILGRLFQHLYREASDRAWGRVDELDMPLPPDRWFDQKGSAVRARNLLAQENCHLIR